MQYTLGSLFAGFGGLDLGFERAGFCCKWQVEINDYANRVLSKHWPNVRRWPDVRTWPQPDTPRVNVIAGGFPCQDISYAGLGAGLDGKRSGLFFEAIRVVRQLEPDVVVLENVAALLTRGLDRVLGTLATLGFDAEWHCIPAAYFGTHFRRDRLFIIAHRSLPGCMRWEGLRPNTQGTWSEQQFARLVERELQLCVPAGKNNRVSDGLSNRVERLRGIGNAIVPQVAQFVANRVLEICEKNNVLARF